MRAVGGLVLTAGLLLITACGGDPQPPAPGRDVVLADGLDTRVTRVVDGDTLVVDGGHRIRLIGIDTPESVDPRSGPECFGTEASQALADLLPPGTGVRLVGDVEAIDAYQRTLAYVYRLADGLFVNAEMVRTGHARTLTIPPNVSFAAELAELAGAARQEGRGLWASCAPAA